MAMDQSVFLEFLETVKAGDVDDRIRVAAKDVYLALTDAVAVGKPGRVAGSGVYQRSWTLSLLTRGWVGGPKSKEVLTAVQG